MRHIFVVCLLFFASTAIAATDIVATYEYSDGNKITIVTRDIQHVRMETSPTSYMLLKEDKVYSVSQDDTGQWMVMDMDQMRGMSSSQGFMSLFGGGESKPEPEISYSAAYEKTGQKEKIAGYTGYVYNVETTENGQIVRRDEVVLGSHSDLKKVNEAWTTMSSRMGQIMGQEMSKSLEEATKEAREAGYGGMLRYGDEMKLHSLRKMNLNLSYYQIPQGSKMVEMGAMPTTSSSQPTPSNPPQVQTQPQAPDQPIVVPQSQQPAESGLEKDAKDVGEVARDEAKQSTEEEVRQGVRKLFKGLFD
ncbi:MAG: hypothetical protein ABIJ59_15390 [Pseudomonadota bacterium]